MRSSVRSSGKYSAIDVIRLGRCFALAAGRSASGHDAGTGTHVGRDAARVGEVDHDVAEDAVRLDVAEAVLGQHNLAAQLGLCDGAAAQDVGGVVVRRVVEEVLDLRPQPAEPVAERAAGDDASPARERRHPFGAGSVHSLAGRGHDVAERIDELVADAAGVIGVGVDVQIRRDTTPSCWLMYGPGCAKASLAARPMAAIKAKLQPIRRIRSSPLVRPGVAPCSVAVGLSVALVSSWPMHIGAHPDAQGVPNGTYVLNRRPNTSSETGGSRGIRHNRCARQRARPS